MIPMKRYAALLLALLLVFCALPARAFVTLEDAMGAVDGATYTNALLNLGCALPGWRYWTKEEVLSRTGQIGERSDSLREKMEKGALCIVMGAENQDGCTIGISLTFIGSEAALFARVGMKAVFSAQLQAVKKSLESQGLENVKVKNGSVLLDGHREYALRMSYTSHGVSYDGLQMPFIWDQYVVKIDVLVPAGLSVTPEDVFQRFYWLEYPA